MRRIDNDQDWEDLRQQWPLREGVAYLNHGSFGPPPQPVIDRQRHWQQQLDSQPMEFFVLQFEPAWLAARDAIAKLTGASPGCLALVENATYGMNVVARSVPLKAGDEVLITTHEYGAVRAIWERACREQGAVCREAPLPSPVAGTDELVDRILSAVTPATRVLVVSHITSPTALILPDPVKFARSVECGRIRRCSRL